MKDNLIRNVTSLANGNWLGILNSLCGDIHYNKAQPCPNCGGHDRFTFDDLEGRGTYVCRGCGSGDALSLVAKVHSVNAREAALMVAPYVGLDMAQPIDAERVIRHQQQSEAKQRQRQQQASKRRERAAQYASDIARTCCRMATGTNGYLQHKNVKPFGSLELAKQIKVNGICLAEGTLVIPVFNPSGLSSLQFITTDGRKIFLVGGQIKDGMFPLCSQIAQSGDIYIGEGFATCAAVAEDIANSQVICAFNAGGLVGVARAVRRSRPQAEIIILADNDLSGAGEHYAKVAAIAANGSYIMPRAC
ncbi:primase-helicase zinc-binding domain-containing protein [Shewanella bicestrii]